MLVDFFKMLFFLFAGPPLVLNIFLYELYPGNYFIRVVLKVGRTSYLTPISRNTSEKVQNHAKTAVLSRISYFGLPGQGVPPDFF